MIQDTGGAIEKKKLGWDHPKENGEGQKSTSAQVYDESLYRKYKILKVSSHDF